MPKITFDCWELFASVIMHTSRVLLYGPWGTGKTYASLTEGMKDGQVALSTTCNPDMTPMDFVGSFMPDGTGGSFYLMAPPITAFKEGHRLGLQEIHKAVGSDGFANLNAICDDPELARMTIGTGETVRAHLDFQLVATMNGMPEDLLPRDILDRFPVRILIDKPHPGAVAALPEDLRQIALDTCCLEDEARRVSIRGWNQYGRLREKVGEEMAAFSVFRNRADEILGDLRVAGS